MAADDSPRRETQEAQLALVEEHIRQENRHDLEGIMATFGAAPEYEDTSWNEHHTGRDAVQAYYEELLRGGP